ncbi:DMT family transporter [Methylobacillus arboreus]|uniref:DMT family transporter n=1 Tax=Methylobacillus arboreus TaxID=755170 RepID=UPI001E2ECADD|nr:DMT family transporter [Methylobacillus arboreus]MCB5190913.1 DMT family transporter [Methylobacillus arboreus]
MRHLQAACRKLWHSPILLLLYTASIWGCNAVAAKLATGNISPMSLVLLRWLIVCAVLAFFLQQPIRREWPLLRANWRRFLWLGFAGFTGFSALFYLAAYKTTAVNITLLQTSMPPFIMLGAWLFFKEQISSASVAGMIMALCGMVLIASQGRLETLAGLSFNLGDIAIILACLLYAAYTLSIRKRPVMPALVFFFGMSIGGLVTALPLLLAEAMAGYTYWPNATGWWILLFVTFGPTLTAQLAYMRGVELIGPSRASLFPCLVPALGALFAVLILGEPFLFHHGLALVLGLGGVYLAEVRVKLLKPARVA